MEKTWDEIVSELRLSGFYPLCQDHACIYLVKRRKVNGVSALDLIEQGHIDKAIYACDQEWASFPGEPYGQGAQRMPRLLAHYQTFLKGYLAETTA
jgi:muramidase (phage lysozyme)